MTKDQSVPFGDYRDDYEQYRTDRQEKTHVASNEWLPCPFCGAPAVEARWPEHRGCSDPACGAHNANLSKQQWNRRPTVETQRAASNPSLAAEINALPDRVRQYIHDLETNADPAGDKWRLLALEQDRAGLTDEVERLTKALRIAELKASGTLANNLCPDHRDKQTGRPCLACEIERLTAERDRLTESYVRETHWARGEIERLRRLLWKFGRHSSTCDLTERGAAHGGVCNCGWDQLERANLSRETPAMPNPLIELVGKPGLGAAMRKAAQSDIAEARARSHGETGGEHNDVCCRVERNAFACTLPKGHAGRHEAWGSDPLKPRYLIDSWPAPETPARFYACCNDECKWSGPEASTVHPKHDPDKLCCPDCGEVVEMITANETPACTCLCPIDTPGPHHSLACPSHTVKNFRRPPMTIQRWRFSVTAGNLAGTQSNPPPGDPPAILGTPENGEYIALEDFEAVRVQVQQMAAGLEDISAQLQRVIGAG